MTQRNEPGKIVELMKKAQSGNEDAMVRLIFMFRPLIRKIATRFSPNDRDDIEQELYYSVIKAIRVFQIQNTSSKK